MERSPVRQKDVTKKLAEKLSLGNALAAPRLTKIVINTGLGRVLASATKADDLLEEIANDMAKLTGQRPVVTRAKKSIASFKTRVGQPLGLKVTLRGKRMEDFLNRLIHVALPRSRDFKGVDAHAVDRNGNLTIGIKEHNIFPEVADTSRVIGLEITCVTNTEDKDASLMLLADLGIPFKKEEKNG